MDKELFKDLVQSLNEARSIVRGKKKPSRVFDVKTPDVKMIRERTGLSIVRIVPLLTPLLCRKMLLLCCCKVR